MKPLGIHLIISGTAAEPTALDDDFEWHARQPAFARMADASRRPARLVALRERGRTMVRLLRSRAGEPSARRA